MGLSRNVAVLLSVFCLATVMQAQQTGPRPRPPTGIRPPSMGEDSFYLAGRVLHAEDFKIAPRILVRLFASNGAVIGMTFTDTRGEFEFPGLQRGVYLVEVREEGYELASERVDLNLGSRRDTTILLRQIREASSKPTEPTLSLRELKIPGKARKAFEKGVRELHDNRRPDRSLEHFRKAIELFPDFDEAYVQLGLAHMDQAQYEQGRVVLEDALRVNPQNGRALTVLGTLFGKVSRPEDAAQVLKQAVELIPADWQPHYELAKILREQGNYDAAYEEARRAHDLSPEAPTAHLLLYNVSIQLEKYEAALKLLGEFLQAHPKHPLAPELREKETGLREFVASRSAQVRRRTPESPTAAAPKD